MPRLQRPDGGGIVGKAGSPGKAGIPPEKHDIVSP
jgi:hypothetical protein